MTEKAEAYARLRRFLQLVDSRLQAPCRILDEAFDPSRVYINIVFGDITTEDDVSPSSIIRKIAAMIQKYAGFNGLKARDFLEIIHIVDMDGAFIPDSCIIENSEADTEIVYSDSGIQMKHREYLLKKHRQKRGNIDKITQTDRVWGIPYHVYYMSCNLDHALYGKRNSTDSEKRRDAKAFDRIYGENLRSFRRFIMSPDFFPGGTYNETWNFIKEGMHSLERHSNFGLALPTPAAAISVEE